MTRRTRLRYSEADKALMWDRWQKGDSMNEIARHFAPSVVSWLNIVPWLAWSPRSIRRHGRQNRLLAG